LWVLDRILWPVDPQAPYPVGDGTLPELYKNVLDPVETLVDRMVEWMEQLWEVAQ
jgi:hypothetical protein